MYVCMHVCAEVTSCHARESNSLLSFSICTSFGAVITYIHTLDHVVGVCMHACMYVCIKLKCVLRETILDPVRFLLLLLPSIDMSPLMMSVCMYVRMLELSIIKDYQ